MTLIDTLQQMDSWPHDVAEIQVIDTHISWVILTGEYAYKIKKPVDFGFLNFTTLEQRKHFCEEELRLNQRLAPDIYLEVVGINQGENGISIGEVGENTLEYAVKMRQFAQNQRLDQLLQGQRFELHWIDDLAEQIAEFHQNVPIVGPDSPWGEPDTLWEVVADNYRHLLNVLGEGPERTQVESLYAHAKDSFQQLQDTLALRKAQGHVRECHGDLHLGNITLHEDALRLFDCIEFNLQFRWIDTLSDMAFLLMDIEANGQPRWANRCINLYLEQGGDYEGLRLLNFYKSYRAMVRAKVATLGPVHDLPQLQHYLDLTQTYATPQTPQLLLMHGVSGTGKSYLSQLLLDHTGVIRVRSDVERKRIFRELSLKGEKLDMYGAEMNVRTHNALIDLTRVLLTAGYSVVVDATFIRQRARNEFRKLAESLAVETRIIACECDPKLVRARLNKRVAEGTDASDADVSVMEAQLDFLQPITEEEEAITVTVDTDNDEAVNRLIKALDYPQARG